MPYKERPILFSGPMVRAILQGKKTQTRRIIKPQPTTLPGQGDGIWHHVKGPKWESGLPYVCPKGKRGDRLWVRETHAIHSVDSGTASVGYRERQPFGKTLADTDGGVDIIELGPEDWKWANEHVDGERWRPSIFMPRWASRITLEITEVRVQKLHSITGDDSRAEGYGVAFGPGCFSRAFDSYWEEIHGDGSWYLNPYVWAISFIVLPASNQ